MQPKNRRIATLTKRRDALLDAIAEARRGYNYFYDGELEDIASEELADTQTKLDKLLLG